MKPALLFSLLALLAANALHAQLFLPNFLGATYNGPCPFDSTVTITQIKGWTVYQTTNGRWSGPIDSSRCISVRKPNPWSTGFVVDLAQINPQQPLFVRARLDSFPSLDTLTPDMPYVIRVQYAAQPTSVKLKKGSNCPDDLCSGMLIGIAIPDENGVPGAATRYQTGLEKEGFIQDCFPAERFEGQRIREAVLKFTLVDTTFPSNARIEFYTPGIEPFFLGPSFVSYITAVAAFRNPINVAEISNPPYWSGIFIGLYTAPTYPSPQNLSYIEAFPVPNVATPENITLTVTPDQILEMQPFAQFRGGLVANSATLRHSFTLLNDGGDFCLNFVDLIFENGDALHHAGGQITVNNAYTCMQFKRGGEFRIREGAALHYGDHGTGMLVICADGSLVLERHASLTIDAILQLGECNDALPPSHVYVDLPPGARLAFTEYARVTNRFSHGQQMRLRVRMLGGTLDDAALDADSRALIERIYPEPAPNWADNIQVTPNPFSDRLTLTYTAGREGEMLRARWLDATGRLIVEEPLRATRGINEWVLQRLPAQSGPYLLEIRSEEGHRTVRKMFRAQR
jgi:hypothetical protein